MLDTCVLTSSVEADNTTDKGCQKRTPVSVHYLATLSQSCYLYPLNTHLHACLCFLPPVFLKPSDLPNLCPYTSEDISYQGFSSPPSPYPPLVSQPYCIAMQVLKVLLSMATNPISFEAAVGTSTRGVHASRHPSCQPQPYGSIMLL